MSKFPEGISSLPILLTQLLCIVHLRNQKKRGYIHIHVCVYWISFPFGGWYNFYVRVSAKEARAVRKVPAKITSFKGQGKGIDKKDREDKGEMREENIQKEKKKNTMGREGMVLICFFVVVVVVIWGLFLLAFSPRCFSNSILHLPFAITLRIPSGGTIVQKGGAFPQPRKEEWP